MSPEIVANAVKTADFAASIFSLLGFESFPSKSEKRSDIITAVKLGNPELLKAFCRGIQKGSPVDSFVTPEAWDMPRDMKVRLLWRQERLQWELLSNFQQTLL